MPKSHKLIIDKAFFIFKIGKFIIKLKNKNKMTKICKSTIGRENISFQHNKLNFE